MVAGSISGATSQRESIRAPIGVFVRSSTPASEPARRPSLTVRTSSSVRRVASSISIAWPLRHGLSCPMRPMAAGSVSAR